MVFGALITRWLRRQRWAIAMGAFAAMAVHNHSIESSRKTYEHSIHMAQCAVYILRKTCIIAVRRLLGKSEHPYWSILDEIVVKVLGFSARIGHVKASRNMIDGYASMQRLAAPLFGGHVSNVDLGLGKGSEDALWITQSSDTKLGSCPVILYYHGGGYATGNAGMYILAHTELLTLLEKKHGVKCGVLSIEYPLAPETKFPENLHFCYRAYDAVVGDFGVKPSSVVVGGDSAGGGLALGVAEHAFRRDKHEGIGALSGLVLFSPWMDHGVKSESHKLFLETDFVAGPELLHDFSVSYAGNHELALTHPQISPIHAEVDHLPPLMLTVGEREVFRDDIMRFKTKLHEAQKEVELHTGKETPHIYPLLWPLFRQEATSALTHVADYTARRLKSQS
ncbi:Tuliposide A-converting enzyme 1, chloroplastic [Hondaea fermentalgiana]|uniref:Tuliposide A-converting enzyme 1, chloroplastic n=1 Tax=Hondaea fermentalgiana TaxID=2315210 RepID=A0A2R5G705_9STRA|nr:Tuliposide A-converting enzyme 1, chloroplastic [Hondaea fermentalgiana]|eukprot:GBG26305.1 Tuliposide A-converting enzyme 1, chloroplastic [Hondaea fermentalgiana]